MDLAIRKLNKFIEIGTNRLSQAQNSKKTRLLCGSSVSQRTMLTETEMEAHRSVSSKSIGFLETVDS